MLGPFRAFLLVAPLVLAPAMLATATPSFALERNDADEEVGNSDVRELLKNRLERRQELRDRLMELLEERSERRGKLLDLLQERSERRGELLDLLEERGRGGRLGQLRKLLSEQVERGECLFLTRSLRDADGDFLILVRRRICPDND
jgi:ATP phosphoribosyltransferase regulatory subunit HisZ